jgi:suppressor of fused
MSEPAATARAVEAHVLEHARDVGDEVGFWRVPVPPGEALSRVLIYAHARGHWHYVSDGLWQRGVELCYRVPRDGDTPPSAPLDLLRRVAESFRHRALPAANDTMIWGETLAPGSLLDALAFVRDPELGNLRTFTGEIAFLQCVGITAAEARACVQSSTQAVLDRLAADDALFVTRPGRAELGGLPVATVNAVSRGHTVPTLRWQRDPATARYAVWIEPARMRPTFAEHLVGRVGGGSFLRVAGPERVLRFEPGDRNSAEEVAFEGRPTLLVKLGAAALAAVTRSATATDSLPVGTLDVHFVDEP